MEFANLSWEPWLALGLALLAAEALGASGFLIGAAVAALANAVLVWLLPEMSIITQLVVYAISAVIATAVYFQMFRDAQKNDNTPPINELAASQVGRVVQLETPLNGEGRVQIGDTYWRVTSAHDLPAGVDVEVVGVQGMTLVVAAKDNSQAGQPT